MGEAKNISLQRTAWKTSGKHHPARWLPSRGQAISVPEPQRGLRRPRGRQKFGSAPSGISPHPQPRAGLRLWRKPRAPPGRTPFLGACFPASRFTERRGGGRPDQLLNRSPAVTYRYPRASLTRGGFLAPCETDIRKKRKARSPDLLPSSSSASDEKKPCNYLTKDYQSYRKPE